MFQTKQGFIAYSKKTSADETSKRKFIFILYFQFITKMDKVYSFVEKMDRHDTMIWNVHIDNKTYFLGRGDRDERQNE